MSVGSDCGRRSNWLWRAGRACVVIGALTAVLLSAAPGQEETAAVGPKQRTAEEIWALMEEAGKAPPAWLEEVPLKYPATLDLTWKETPGWKPNEKLGTYLFIVANRDASKLKGGVKLFHHVLAVNKGHAANTKKTLHALAELYFALGEYAHAAYYYRKAGAGTIRDCVNVAYCFKRLGSRDLAVRMLSRLSSYLTRNGEVIRAWASIEEPNRALEAARRMARTQYVDAAYLAAGDVCRRLGRYAEAVSYYEKVVALDSGGRDLKKTKSMAKDGTRCLTGFDRVNLAEIPDGTYAGKANAAFRGPVEVAVTVKGGRIDSVRVSKHREDRTVGAEVTVPERIVEHQGIKGVDAVTGATWTSSAIVNATARALSDAAP